MLPVVVAAAQGEMRLRPDELCAQLKAAGSKPGGGNITAVQSAEPDIGTVLLIKELIIYLWHTAALSATG